VIAGLGPHARAGIIALHLIGLLAIRESALHAEVYPVGGGGDPRIRVATYKDDEVYRLRGCVGYEIDLEFEPGEEFVGLAAGDIDALSFVAQNNHLFLKPKAVAVGTNLTVLTTRRHYHFEYTAQMRRPATANEPDTIYALRFQYPPTDSASRASAAVARVDDELNRRSAGRANNVDYWYCGREELRPVAASDDGVHTRLRFGARAELPAIFVRNEDGAESLLNFSMEDGEVVVHRVAQRLILRRGGLTGCVVNKGYAGSGEQLQSGTVAPGVQRERRGATP
jgi:type IV secretion system protein VirB9